MMLAGVNVIYRMQSIVFIAYYCLVPRYRLTPIVSWWQRWVVYQY